MISVILRDGARTHSNVVIPWDHNPRQDDKMAVDSPYD